MKWIKVKRYCELSGDTPDAIQKKLSRGIGLESVQIKTAPDGARWVNIEAVERWIETGVSMSNPRGVARR